MKKILLFVMLTALLLAVLAACVDGSLEETEPKSDAEQSDASTQGTVSSQSDVPTETRINSDGNIVVVSPRVDSDGNLIETVSRPSSSGNLNP